MRLEGALWLAHMMNIKRATSKAMATKDGFIFLVAQENGAAVHADEQPSGDVILHIFMGIPKKEEPWEYEPGERLLEKVFEVERLVTPDTNYTLKNPLFDCERELARLFGLEDEYWKPL